MARLVEQPVHVEEGPDGSPTVLYWPTGRERIERCLEVWVEVGEWWSGEAPKRFCRVITSRGRVHELYEELCPLDTAREPRIRHVERESGHGRVGRPADTHFLAEFHLRDQPAPGPRRAGIFQKTRTRWILYKTLD